MKHPVLGPYADVQDLARFEYGRMFWRVPRLRRRLIRHWTDPRHPYGGRFAAHREVLEEVLGTERDDSALDAALRARGWSLRTAIREIPPVFGSFWADSASTEDGAADSAKI